MERRLELNNGNLIYNEDEIYGVSGESLKISNHFIKDRYSKKVYRKQRFYPIITKNLEDVQEMDIK